jgi:predicted DNA-binding transcriptional regulator YafY
MPAGFEFHRPRSWRISPDGSLIVRFSASGHLEMAWHLYVWGEDVEVLARRLCASWSTSTGVPDFPALP